MTNHRRTIKTAILLGAAVCCTLLALSKPSTAVASESASADTLPLVRVYGTISHENGSLMLNHVQGDTSIDSLILNVSEETQILDAVNAFPVTADSLKDGETVYAYISPAMTMSLPPQSYAHMIICRIPADFAVPSYETVSGMTADSEALRLLTAKRGMVYGIDSDTVLLPFRTRNIVTAQDLTAGTACLIWPDRNVTDSAGNTVIHAARVMIFPGSGANGTDGAGAAPGPASDRTLGGGVQ